MIRCYTQRLGADCELLTCCFILLRIIQEYCKCCLNYSFTGEMHVIQRAVDAVSHFTMFVRKVTHVLALVLQTPVFHLCAMRKRNLIQDRMRSDIRSLSPTDWNSSDIAQQDLMFGCILHTQKLYNI